MGTFSILQKAFVHVKLETLMLAHYISLTSITEMFLIGLTWMKVAFIVVMVLCLDLKLLSWL